MSILLAAGFGCASAPEEKPERISELPPDYIPLPTEDALHRTGAAASAAKLPLEPVTRGRGGALDDSSLELLRRYDREAWMAYRKDSRRENLDPATRDRLCRRALESLVLAILRQQGTPLGKEYISRGLELVAASGSRTHRFAVPDDGIRERARRKRNTPEGKLVWLYIGRFDLYHKYLLNGLQGCGLNAAGVYWTPTFTLLDLELRGLEEQYLQIVGSPDWK